MAILVGGSLLIGEKPSPRSIDINKHIQEKLNNPNTILEVKPEPLPKAEPVIVEHIIKREIPVKTIDDSVEGHYECVVEGELIKHYNKKSSYLSDMIQLNEDSD